MRRSTEFADTIRKGSRSAGHLLVVHAARAAQPTQAEPARVGFVVSKAVGRAVQRNRVQRRLRAIMAGTDLATGTRIVVRARPAAADASFDELHRDCDHHVERALGKTARPRQSGKVQRGEPVKA